MRAGRDHGDYGHEDGHALGFSNPRPAVVVIITYIHKEPV